MNTQDSLYSTGLFQGSEEYENIMSKTVSQVTKDNGSSNPSLPESPVHRPDLNPHHYSFSLLQVCQIHPREWRKREKIDKTLHK